jgi:hypothetical protein
MSLERADAGLRRDPALRRLYLDEALAQIPRLLGAIDRNPYRPTYGCLDRQFWHYRTAGFPSGMYQEGALPLAIVYATPLPGNRWHCDPRVRELAVAAIRFAARSSHADGSCDDYYPFERALGAAVFSLQAAAAAYRILALDDPELVAWLRRRARWVAAHDESGRLANHQALAALGLLRVGEITGEAEHRTAADRRLQTLLSWQSDEGWFEEYGGADPGYQTVTIDCLAKIRRMTGDETLDEPLGRAVRFARSFLHPDGSYAGEYGSRGTYHYYPHGFELLARENPDAAELAEGALRGIAAGNQAFFSDDRLFAHRLASFLEAYADWSPETPAAPAEPLPPVRCFRRAGLIVCHTSDAHTVISTARGGVFKHFAGDHAAGNPVVTDAGLIVETSDGRVAVSQMHDLSRVVESPALDGDPLSHPFPLAVSGPLHYCRFETATPLKQAVFHVATATAGRWCRTLVRRLLQRRLITGRRGCSIRLHRRFEWLPADASRRRPGLRVTDTIELTSPRVHVRRMSFGVDHQTAYVAASNVYQASVLRPWTDLQSYIESLNARRTVTIVREF